MAAMFRLIFWLLLLPFRILGWVGRRLYVWLHGYNVLALKVFGALPDKHGALGLWAALSGTPRGPALLEVLLAIERAARDPRIQAILLEVGPLHSGLARAEEIRSALVRARAGGKRVVAYLEEGGMAEYMVALGASDVVLAPGGSLGLTGVASEVLFLKGALDKAGVRAWMRARGKYKSAREMFAESEMSEANREMTRSLVDDLYEQLVEAVAEGRKMATDDVKRVLDEGPFLAEAAVKCGLADRTGYKDTVEQALRDELGKWRVLKSDAYLRLSSHLVRRGRPAMVAVLDVRGHIKSGKTVPGKDGPRATGSRSFVAQVEQLVKEKRVKGVLLRVDSPGGSALASDVMWHALCRLRKEKPVVVSMGNVAASGGYYVSGIAGVPILASASTLTGSIGVLAGKFDARGLYDKLGLRKEIVSRGRRAGYLSDYRAFTEDELEKLEEDLDAHYADFVRKMADGRGLTVEELDRVAQGRVWTGRQALGNGLVDARGGLLEALSALRRALGLAEDAPLALVSTSAEHRRLPSLRVPGVFLPQALRLPFDLADYFSHERVLALLPFQIRFR